MPLCVLLIARSGAIGVTVVGSLAVLFAELESPPPDTVAVLVTLEGALDAVKKFMTPVRGFTARSAAEVLKVALGEYDTSIEGGRFVKPVEYQDSRGFAWEAERLIEGVAPELAKVDAAALARIRGALAKLKAAWPAPMPPSAPILQPGEMSALVSDIELHASRY